MSAIDWFRPKPRFIVIRGTGSRKDGMWYERASLPTALHPSLADAPSLTVHATGRYERREDGLLAEIYEPEGAAND